MNTVRVYSGNRLVTNLINKLTFELYLPGGYHYCGPETELSKRLSRGDQGINQLESFCKEHDIIYSKNKDINVRNIAGKILAKKSKDRIYSIDANIGEKAAALAVSIIMKVKSDLGMGLEISDKKLNKNKKLLNKKRKLNKNQKTFCFKKLIKSIVPVKKNGSVQSVLKDARYAVKKSGGKKV